MNILALLCVLILPSSGTSKDSAFPDPFAPQTMQIEGTLTLEIFNADEDLSMVSIRGEKQSYSFIVDQKTVYAYLEKEFGLNGVLRLANRLKCEVTVTTVETHPTKGRLCGKFRYMKRLVFNHIDFPEGFRD